MKTILSRGLIAILGLLAIAGCASPEKAQRVPSQSGATDTPNLQILRSIPPVPGLENKRPDEDKIADQITELFKSFADKNKSAGTLHRSTHAKGTCFPGVFTVLSAKELERDYGI